MIRRAPDTPAGRLARALAPWRACDLCAMSAWRRHVVFGRGDVPAEVMFIGMAPGRTEDLTGGCFTGESGRWLRALVRAAARRAGRTPTCYYTNIVACRPSDAPQGPNRDPTAEEAIYCRPRLADELAIVGPRRVVCFGEVAAREAAALCPDAAWVVHPAFLARMKDAGKAARLAAVRTLADVFKGGK